MPDDPRVHPRAGSTSPSSNRKGLRPLTARKPVRLWLGIPFVSAPCMQGHNPAWDLGVRAGVEGGGGSQRVRSAMTCGFESRWERTSRSVRLVVRMPGFHPGDHGFEPHTEHPGIVAQSG